MKKILIIIMLFMSFSLKVNAEVIYGEYKSVEGVYEESDEVKKESYKIYNTYETQYKDMGYLEENDTYIKDTNDFTMGLSVVDDYISETDEVVSLGFKNKKVNSFNFDNIVKGTKIYDISIYCDGVKINYDIMSENLTDIDFIKDNNRDTFSKALDSTSYIKFLLDDYYDLEKLVIIMYTVNEKEDRSVDIDFKDNTPINIVILQNFKTFISFKDNNIPSYYYTKKLLYKYYNEEKVATNNYKESGDNLIYDDYKIIDKYYKREKIILEDNIVFDTYDKNINDFIIYSSSDVETKCEYDLLKNGKYICNFKVGDINFDREVFVDIKENIHIEEEIKKDLVNSGDVFENQNLISNKNNNEDVQETKDLISDKNNNEEVSENNKLINNMTNKNDNSNFHIDEENADYSNVLDTDNQIKDNVQSETKDDFYEDEVVDVYYYDKSSKKKDSKTKTKKKKYLFKIVKYLLFIIIICIEIILYIKKKRKGRFVENV